MPTHGLAREREREYLGHSKAGPLAQRSELSAHNRLVPGSNPGGPTAFAECVRGVGGAGARPHRGFRRAWYQIGTKIFAIRGYDSCRKHGRRSCGELVQGNPHVIDLEMAVGLVGEARVSMAHDA